MESLLAMAAICAICLGPLVVGLGIKEGAGWLRRWLDHRARMTVLEYARRESAMGARIGLPEWVDVHDPASVEQWRRAHVEVHRSQASAK